jgi:hypothetical protein
MVLLIVCAKLKLGATVLAGQVSIFKTHDGLLSSKVGNVSAI